MVVKRTPKLIASTSPSAVNRELDAFCPVTMLPDRVAKGLVSLVPCLKIAPYFLSFASMENGTMPPAPSSSSSTSVVPVICAPRQALQ